MLFFWFKAQIEKLKTDRRYEDIDLDSFENKFVFFPIICDIFSLLVEMFECNSNFYSHTFFSRNSCHWLSLQIYYFTVNFKHQKLPLYPWVILILFDFILSKFFSASVNNLNRLVLGNMWNRNTKVNWNMLYYRAKSQKIIEKHKNFLRKKGNWAQLIYTIGFPV